MENRIIIGGKQIPNAVRMEYVYVLFGLYHTTQKISIFEHFISTNASSRTVRVVIYRITGSPRCYLQNHGQSALLFTE
jgi:hypothetical protein